MPEIPAEILSKLMAFASANGVDLGVAPMGSENGDKAPTFPSVNLNRATSELAHETGLNLKRSGLYLYAGNLVTVEDDGSSLEMDVDRFRTWIDRFQLNFSKRRKVGDGDDAPTVPIKATMKKDVASVMLRSDEFRAHIPEIKRILPVRLPVLDNEEDRRGLRVLGYGYDAATQVFTCNTGIHYALDWPLEKAVTYLRETLNDFPFADAGRSLAVQLSAMLTVFCQLIFQPLDRWPMIYFNANTPGSGKSRLAELCVYMVYGTAEAVTYAENDEFVKALDTWSQRGVAYTFFDDVSGLVKNNALNRWLTFPTWTGRVMHTQKTFSVLNQTLTLLTGNQATLSDDLGRRSLMVDLWSAETPEARAARIKTVIDAEWLAATSNRQDILSALYALLRHWAEECEQAVYKKLIPSFEGWSRIVPAVVTAAGFDCPLQAPDVQDAGQKQNVEFQRMIEAAVKEYEPTLSKPAVLTLPMWAELCRGKGLFHSIISDVETVREEIENSRKGWKRVPTPMGVDREPDEKEKEEQAFRYLDKPMATKFGHLLHKFYRGQVREVNGIKYQFADREARHSTFALSMLPEGAVPSRDGQLPKA